MTDVLWRRYLLKIHLLFLLIVIVFPPVEAMSTEDYRQMPGVIQVHTTFDGSGANSIDQLVALASQKGMEFIIPTDHDLQVMEYGIFPLENLLKKREHRGSVIQNGPAKYLDEIRNANKSQKDVLVIPGVQSSPFYYWTGSPFGGGLTAHDYRKEMLLIGMDDPKDYLDLPLLHRGFSKRYVQTLLPRTLVFVLAFVLSLYLISQRGAMRIAGVIICIFSSALAINHHPFKSSLFDPYHGDQGVKPFQELIDYVNERNGLTFWAHPESNYAVAGVQLGPVTLKTAHYPDDLIASKDYTGFEAIYGDTSRIPDPGKQWDKVLGEYRTGKRNRPVWCISGADFHGESEDDAIDMYQTVLLVKERSVSEVIEALSEGRSYAMMKIREPGLTLDRFVVRDASDNTITAVSGEEVNPAGHPVIDLMISSQDGAQHPVAVMLIKDGKILERFDGETPLAIDYIDQTDRDGKSYYRLEAKMKNGNRLLSNPIFVVKK